MPIELIVASDSHGRSDLLTKLEQAYPKADAYIHCGDLEDNAGAFPRWIFVRGNNDWMADSQEMPDSRILSIGRHRFLMLHSDICSYMGRERQLAQMAHRNDCDVVLFGHTHRSDIETVDSILEINPGSLWYPRDINPPSYARIVIDDDGTIHPQIIFKPEWPFSSARPKSTKKKNWFR